MRVRGRPQGPGRRRAIELVALTALAACTAGLVWAASVNGRDVAQGQTARPIPEVTPTASASPAPPFAAAPQSRLIVPTGENTAWRTASLACAADATATIESTSDAGATWEAFSLAEVEAASILAIEPLDGVHTVGAVTQSRGDCALGYDISFTSGQFWRGEPDPVTEVAYAEPGQHTLVAGTARLPIECATPVDFAVRNDNEAAVICEDGVLRTTADAAVTWQEPEVDSLAISATAVDSGYLIAAVRHDECPGVRLVVLRAADAGQEDRACLPAFDETDPVDLAVLGDDVWAWVGSEVGVSRDGGVTWPEAWQAPQETVTE